MQPIATLASPRFLLGTLLAGLSFVSPCVQAQTATITYDLNDVWLLPDITHPGSPAQQMTGTFEWTYTVGDFENGTGQFLSFQVPWWSPSLPPLGATIENNAIEIVMIGNFHGLGFDLTLRLAPSLSPYLPSPIDPVRSAFDIEVGISRRGHVISGSVVPRCPPQNYGIGSAGSGGFVPTITSSGGDPRIANGSFQIDCDQLLGGAPCALLLGTRKAQFPVLGVNLLVDPSNWFVIPLQASGAVGVPGDGTLQAPLPIPDAPLIIGVEFDLQVVAIDTGSPQGLAAATDGLTMVICL